MDAPSAVFDRCDAETDVAPGHRVRCDRARGHAGDHHATVTGKDLRLDRDGHTPEQAPHPSRVGGRLFRRGRGAVVIGDAATGVIALWNQGRSAAAQAAAGSQTGQ